MNTILRWPAVLLSLALITGCDIHGDTMGDLAGALGEHMTAFEAEMAGHAAQVDAANDLERIVGAEDGHHARAGDHLSGMQHEIGDMMSCSSGMMDGMGRAMMDMDDISAACDEHRDAMRTAPDVMTARAEESRHQEAMRRMISDMRTHMGSLGGEPSMMCGHHR